MLIPYKINDEVAEINVRDDLLTIKPSEKAYVL